MVRAPKSAAAFPRDDMPMVGMELAMELDMELEATVTSGGALGSTAELLMPETAARSNKELAVKFWTMRSEPPKSTTAIKRSGPAFASMNFWAAPRA